MSPEPRIYTPAEIAGAARLQWPEPSLYQATVMTTIALMESGGNARALYYNTSGLFAETLDRGVWGINEAAITNVTGQRFDPRDFSNLQVSAFMARQIWDWRYRQRANPSESLVYAYEGWTTYRTKTTNPTYAAAWKALWPSAARATGFSS